jgi:hypothetical protein
MFAALNLDRGNISNATSDNMLDDLGLTQADYVRGSPDFSAQPPLMVDFRIWVPLSPRSASWWPNYPRN